jgi:hypothetical protein
VLFVILGAAAGVLLAGAELPLLSALIDTASIAVGETVRALVTWVAGVLGLTEGSGATVTALAAAFLGGITPALTAATAAALTRTAQLARVLVGVAVLVAALSSFATLPFTQALVVVGAAGALAALLSMATGALLVVPLAALTVVVAVRSIKYAVASTSLASPFALEISELIGADPARWQATMMITSIGVCVGALASLVRR